MSSPPSATPVDAQLRKQAWDYFQLHANQRLTTFNYYLILCTAISTAEVASFTKEFRLPGLPLLLGMLLMAFSFVFRSLDDRNRLLVKNAEAALKFYEELDSKDVQITHLFRYEEIRTVQAESTGLHLKYSDCFRFLFWTFGLVGLFSVVAEIIGLLTKL